MFTSVTAGASLGHSPGFATAMLVVAVGGCVYVVIAGMLVRAGGVGVGTGVSLHLIPVGVRVVASIAMRRIVAFN
ncbi:MAG: hypothetical protein AAGB04_12965 [Pseudomonadota bacterium]